MVAVLVVPVHGVRADPKHGDTYELTLTRDMAQHDNRGGTSSSHDQDTLIERVIEARADGLELEYDFPKETTAQQRASEWHFPARVFKPSHGPTQLLNGVELEARLDGWLKGGGMTRANCGQLIFTWNAFRIDCEPRSVIRMIQRFDLTTFDAREGARYLDPNAIGPVTLVKGPSGPTLVAEMPVNPDAVRRGRAETDVSVAQLMRKSLTIDDALRERAKDTVAGTISVAFEIGQGGEVERRTEVTKLEIGRPDGRVESQTTTETLERRLVPTAGSAKATVSRLLEAIRKGDQAGFADAGPKLVIMATPDFGAPITWVDAQKTFGGCALQALSEPKPLDGVPAYIVSATMTCPAPLPNGPLTFDFLADGKQVHGVYPGGIDRFYPKLGRTPDKPP